MASTTTYGDWMRPMPGGIRNIGRPLTLAGLGVLVVTLVLCMVDVLAAIIFCAVGVGVIAVLAVRDREHRNMVDRQVERRTYLSQSRSGRALYRSGMLAPIESGRCRLPGVLSDVTLVEADDEMHRALRASPLMVDRLDLLTRLNRQWGVGQIMITHTFADLLCLDTQAQNNKARGFVERSKIKVLGALNRTEVQRYLRGESGLPISVREEDMLADWATPTDFSTGASYKGIGKFLIKLGGLPGIPVNVELCDLERSGFNDTNRQWH